MEPMQQWYSMATQIRLKRKALRGWKEHGVPELRLLLLFYENSHPQVPQEKFLGNEKKKSRFISLLKASFKRSQITKVKAEEDTDILIIATANSLSSQHHAIIIIGQDINLLVLLTALSPPNVYYQKVGKSKSPNALYSNKCFKHIKIVENILLFHTISGCDTTGAPFDPTEQGLKKDAVGLLTLVPTNVEGGCTSGFAELYMMPMQKRLRWKVHMYIESRV